jgi:uncharacterized protein (DUF3084 family)
MHIIEQINVLRESLMAAEEAKTQYSLEVKTANNELRKFQQLDGQMKGLILINTSC